MNNPAAKQASIILQNAKEEVLEILKDTNLGLISISIRSGLDKLINQLNFLSGESQVAPVHAAGQFKPITSFMGEPINRPKKVTPEQLVPQNKEKNAFLEQVKELEKNFPLMSNEKILDKYKVPAYSLTLRGVAKRAGLENYRDGNINNQFIDDIRAGMEAQIESQTQRGKLDKVTGKLATKITPVPIGEFEELPDDENTD